MGCFIPIVCMPNQKDVVIVMPIPPNLIVFINFLNIFSEITRTIVDQRGFRYKTTFAQELIFTFV